MGFFSKLFGGKAASTPSTPATEQETKTLSETQENIPDSQENKNPAPIQYGTRMPIDAVYAYIEYDYEDQGYSDAMCNVDSSYKESKKQIIKNGLKRLFEQVSLRYKSDLRDIEVQIEIVEQQGMTTTASSLKARKETFLEHMRIMKEMEVALDREEQQMLSMINSYERGFLKGLAAKTDTLLRNDR